jgi:hypothetical protein
MVHVARQIAGAASCVIFIETSRLGHIDKSVAFGLHVTHPRNPRTIPARRIRHAVAAFRTASVGKECFA